MPFLTTESTSVDVDVDVEIADDEIVEYVLCTTTVLERVMAGYEPDVGQWAAAFSAYDTLDRDKAIAELERAIPGLKVTLP